MADDSGHLQVLEAFLVAMVLLGAAYTVTSLRLPTFEGERTRADLGRVTTDGLTVLAGLKDDSGNLLDHGMTEAYHCLNDPTPSLTDCPTKTSANLTLRIEADLPVGAAYAVILDNGVKARELYRTNDAQGEVVSAGVSYVPDWNLTFLLPELSCYETTMDVNLTMLPLVHGAVGTVTTMNVSMSNGKLANGTAAFRSGWWNVTLPLANRSTSGEDITAVTVGKRGTFPGTTHYGSCDLGGHGNDVRGAIRNSTLALTSATTAIGGSVTFNADITPFATTPGVTAYNASLVVYDPVTPRGTEADTYIPSVVLPLGTGTTPSTTWEIPTTSLYGAHPVVLRVNATVGSTIVQARLPAVLTVALPSGVVPIEAPYRAILQTWFPDWH